MSGHEIRKSLREFQQALVVDPTNVDLREQLFEELLRHGFNKQASEELALCTKLAAAKGNLPRALSSCKRLLQLDPSRRDVLSFLSRFYARSSEAQAENLLRDLEQPGSAPIQPQPPAPRFLIPPLNLPEVNREPFTPLETDRTRIAPLDACESIELTIVNIDPLDGDDFPERSLRRDGLDDSEALPIRRSELPKIPLFSSLSAKEFERLLDEMELTRLATGVEVKNQLSSGTGETHTAIHILARGRVAAFRRANDGESVNLGEVPLGSFFGEFELLTERSSPIRYRTLSPCDLLCVPAERFRQLRAQHPAIAESLREIFEKRLLREQIVMLPQIRQLSMGERELLLRRAKTVELGPAQVLIQKGEHHQSLFVVLSGCLELRSGNDQCLGQLEAGDRFGTTGLYSDKPSMCTVMTLTRSRVARLHRDAFERGPLSQHLSELDAPLDDPLELGILELSGDFG
jgi:CRP-like cAMP-binding protein